MEGWVGLSTMSVNNLLKVNILESGPGGTRTRDLWVTSLRPYHNTTETLTYILRDLFRNDDIMYCIYLIKWNKMVCGIHTGTRCSFWTHSKFINYTGRTGSSFFSTCTFQVSRSWKIREKNPGLSGMQGNHVFNKKAELSQRWPRDALNIWVP